MLGLYLDHKLGVLFISQSIFDFIQILFSAAMVRRLVPFLVVNLEQKRS